MLLIITGPTASGKTNIAEKLAKLTEGEIISADSRTLYRTLDIGTAKYSNDPDLRYHLLNVVEIGENFSSYDWVCNARRIVAEILSRNRTPIICGGTMHYIHLFINGIKSVPGPDWKLRRSLKQIAAEKGKKEVHDILEKIDPDLSRSVHPNNLDRVIRYIERARGGVSVESVDPYKGKYELFFIEPSRDLLRTNINSRLEKMLSLGWVNEVRNLMDRGYDLDTPGVDSIGYREIFELANGKIGSEKARSSIISRSMEYSRRQMNWKQRLDPNLIRIDRSSDIDQALDIMLGTLRMNCTSHQCLSRIS